MTVDFLFDFGSPNAYLSHRVVPDIEKRTGARFIYVPVLLGGIFKLTSNDGQNMVPGLWKIPLLGALFRNKIESENTDELMIFITPRIMK